MPDGLIDSMKSWLTETFGLSFAATPTTVPGMLDEARVATLKKTFAYLKTQSPEQALKPLGDIASELVVATINAEDGGRPLPPGVTAFQAEVQTELDGLKIKAEDAARAHAADWQSRMIILPPSRGADDPAEKTKKIKSLLAEIEPALAVDLHMLGQVGGNTGILDLIPAYIADLKEQYKGLTPKRKTEGPPTALAAGGKPAIGTGDPVLNADEQRLLKDNIGAAQGLMGQDKATNPDAVLAYCAVIAKGVNLKSAAQAMKDYHYNWNEIKAGGRALKELDVATGEKFMAQMWWYRRMVIDKLMSELQKTYGFIWGSVGSDNPESDYDLTIRTHGKNKDGSPFYDYQIVKEVNTTLSAQFGGAPPGIIFDCNLYAEAKAESGPEDPSTQSAPVKAMGAMKEQGQDVGALMKLRRFMDWDGFEDYKQNMLKGMADPEARKLMQQQFDEADALFFMARAEQLAKAAAQNPDFFARWSEASKIKSLPDTIAGQRTLLEMAEALEHDDTKVMAANNEIYLEKLADVRKLEEDYKAATDPEKKSALLAKLKTLQADATFFAAEAYHSEGPLLHVVKAGQSSKLEIEGNGTVYPTPQAKQKAIDDLKATKLANLSLNQMLQSFNENLGDLLKDLRHYAGEDFPGLGFYRCSKYVERLCDAVIIIASRMPETQQAGFNRIQFGGRTPTDVRAGMAGLVDIRGDKKGFAAGEGVNPEEEKQAYAVEQMTTIFPAVITLADLAKVASKFGEHINSAVRSAMAADLKASAATTGAYTGAGTARGG